MMCPNIHIVSIIPFATFASPGVIQGLLVAPSLLSTKYLKKINMSFGLLTPVSVPDGSIHKILEQQNSSHILRTFLH